MDDWLALGGLLGGVAALGQLAYQAVKTWRGGELRKSQAEAAKASLDNLQAEASLPHVAESLKLGNVAEAVTIQQQVINGLREHAAWQDGQIKGRDDRIADLEARLEDRDRKIAELEKRLGLAETEVAAAKRIIGELRETSRAEQKGPHA